MVCCLIPLWLWVIAWAVPPVVTRRPSVCDLSVPWQRHSGPRPDTARDDTRRGAPRMAKLMNITNSNDFSLWYIISSYIYGTYTVVNGIVNQLISWGATKSHRRTVHDLLLSIIKLLSLDRYWLNCYCCWLLLTIIELNTIIRIYQQSWSIAGLTMVYGDPKTEQLHGFTINWFTGRF
jgi:hypothetical protein